MAVEMYPQHKFMNYGHLNFGKFFQLSPNLFQYQK